MRSDGGRKETMREERRRVKEKGSEKMDDKRKKVKEMKCGG